MEKLQLVEDKSMNKIPFVQCGIWFCPILSVILLSLDAGDADLKQFNQNLLEKLKRKIQLEILEDFL